VGRELPRECRLRLHHGIGSYGVWKSIDGGASWNRVLTGDQFFGASDLAISPTDPNRLYAGLQLSGVWTTADGGTNWTKLGGGLPTTDVARVDVAVDPQNASKVYASSGQARTTCSSESFAPRTPERTGAR
jgi:photosystem II stability/assembly factor-like uncharacterized protein